MKQLIYITLFCTINIKVFAQWSTIYNVGSDFFYITYFTSKNIGFCGGVGEIIKTTNGGASWNSYQTPGSSIESIYFLNKDTGYAVGGTSMGTLGLILRTTDAGATWGTQSSTITNPLYSVYFATKDTGYAIGINGTIVRTINAGANWVAQNSGGNVFLTSVYFTNSMVGYAVGANGTILKTINAGQNWTLQTSGTTAFLAGVKFTSNNTGYACGGLVNNTPVLLQTLNGGTNWTPQNLPTFIGKLHTFSFLNSNEAYVVGENGAIIHTNNAGAVWTQQTSGISSRLFSVHFPAQDTGYAVGEYKIILKLSGSMATGIFSNVKESDFMNVGPNPNNGIFSLNLNSVLEKGNIEIYNAVGSNVFSEVLYNKKTEIDISKEPAGIYFIKIGTEVKKIIKE